MKETKRGVLFNCQESQVVGVRIYVSGIPHSFRGPVSRCDARPDEIVGLNVLAGHGIDEISEFTKVVEFIIFLREQDI